MATLRSWRLQNLVSTGEVEVWSSQSSGTHICTAPSVINSLHQRLYCVPLMDLYWHIVITRVHGLPLGNAALGALFA